MNRICTLTLAATSLLFLTMVLPAGEAAAQSAKDLVGSWTLVSLTAGEGDKKSEPYGPSPHGLMMIDASGRFSITIARKGVPKFAGNSRTKGTAEENQAAVHGSIAYFGKYTVSEADKMLSMTVEASNYPNFEGSSQKRLIALKGDELTLTNPNPSAGGGAATQVWRRAK